MAFSKEKIDETLKQVPRYIKTLAMDIIVVIVSFAYIFYQMIKLEPTDLNPFVLLAESIMSIICGVTIKTALGENGFSKGYNNIKWIEEEEKYNGACKTANDYMERVDNFYQYEEIERKRNYRRIKLQGIRLKYDDWFDKDGNYIGTPEMEEKLDRKQKRILHKAVIVPICLLNLFSEYEISSDQDTKKEKTDKVQRRNSLAKNSIFAVLIAIVGAYFVPLFNNWSWASLIAATMQVALWVLFGILQLYNNFDFVVNEKVAILRKKKELINKFVVGCERGEYIYSPYDTMIKITSK